MNVGTDAGGGLVFDPSKTALLIHWQKEIASPGGRNAEDMPQRVRAEGTIARTQAVLNASRKRGMLVVYVNGVHARVIRSRGPGPFRWRPGLSDVARC